MGSFRWRSELLASRAEERLARSRVTARHTICVIGTGAATLAGDAFWTFDDCTHNASSARASPRTLPSSAG
jgi:hypothetical protein